MVSGEVIIQCFVRVSNAVSYTHLDVYKRQEQQHLLLKFLTLILLTILITELIILIVIRVPVKQEKLYDVYNLLKTK